MKIFGIILKVFLFTSMSVVVSMLHFVMLSMVIENPSTTHIIVFGITYPVTVFITYVYVLAVNYCIIDEILEKWNENIDNNIQNYGIYELGNNARFSILFVIWHTITRTEHNKYYSICYSITVYIVHNTYLYMWNNR